MAFNYLNPTDDPKQFIAEHLNSKQSEVRSLLGQMNSRKNRRSNELDELMHKRMALSPYEGVMLRQNEK